MLKSVQSLGAQYKFTIYLNEVAIESWPEWDLKPQPLNSVLYKYFTIYQTSSLRLITS